MAFKIAASPGVTVREIDLTTVVQSAEATDGFIAGPFNWGPVDEVVTVNNEDTLLKRAGKPQSVKEATTFFSAAAFLAYTDKLRYVRIGGANKSYMRNAVSIASPTSSAWITGASATIGSPWVDVPVEDTDATPAGIVPSIDLTNEVGTVVSIGGTVYTIVEVDVATAVTDWASPGTPTTPVTHRIKLDRAFEAATGIVAVSKTTTNQLVLIKNDEAYENASFLPAVEFIAKYPGEFGNDLKVVVCASASQYLTPKTGTGSIAGTWSVEKGKKWVAYDDTASPTTNANTYFSAGDYFVVNNVKYQVEAAVAGGLTLSKAYAGTTATGVVAQREWQYAKFFGKAPTTNHGHIMVIDDVGTFSGVEGTILELYNNVAISDTLSTETTDDGSANYWKTAINRKSQFVRTGDFDMTSYALESNSSTLVFSLGFDGNELYGLDEHIDAYSSVINADSVDVSLIIAPNIGTRGNNATIANYIIDNICEVRKDCVVFISPNRDAVVDNKDGEVEDIIAFRDELTSSSYAIVDSGWKQVYDKYNDTYRWIPLAADIAGLTARTEQDRAPWYSPAGFNRGILKNVVKLAWSPVESQRDDLYTNGVNSVVNFKGAGNILYGDKTIAANQTSAFSHINVRRLFIVIEKAIANAAKYMLFEFNDEFTRAQFVAMVEPFLRDVKGGRGIQDFKVVCDETNNTGQVIDSNGFVGDIYIKPARSINFITLNFVAVRTDVSFEEVVGSI